MLQCILKILRDIEQTFVRVTTAVVFVSAIYTGICWGMDCEVGVDLLWQILGTSLFCAIGFSVVFFNQECSKWKMFGKRILYFLFVNMVVLGAGYLFEWFYLSSWKMIIWMEISIIAVFVIVSVVSYFVDYTVAEKMNEKIQERNQDL